MPVLFTASPLVVVVLKPLSATAKLKLCTRPGQIMEVPQVSILGYYHNLSTDPYLSLSLLLSLLFLSEQILAQLIVEEVSILLDRYQVLIYRVFSAVHQYL